jgi:iron complex transport system substrate-binding protein
MWKRIAIIAVIVLLVAAVAVLGVGAITKGPPKGPPAAAGLTVVDGLGRAVTIPQPVERIISIAGAATETLYAIGCGDKIVGVDKYSDYPPEVKDKPEVGSGFNLNREMVLGLDPDLVVCWWFHTDAIEWLEEQGIPTIAINPTNVDEVLTMTRLLGVVMGHTSEADALVAEMEEKIDAVVEKVKDIPSEDRPLVYYELSTAMKTLNYDTFTSDLIFMAGGINLAAAEPVRYPILTSEYIINKNPDVIVVVSYGASPDEIKARGGWDAIDAVKTDRVYSIDTHWVTASPRLVLGLEQFAQWFYPDLFEEV